VLMLLADLLHLVAVAGNVAAAVAVDIAVVIGSPSRSDGGGGGGLVRRRLLLLLSVEMVMIQTARTEERARKLVNRWPQV